MPFLGLYANNKTWRELYFEGGKGEGGKEGKSSLSRVAWGKQSWFIYSSSSSWNLDKKRILSPGISFGTAFLTSGWDKMKMEHALSIISSFLLHPQIYVRSCY